MINFLQFFKGTSGMLNLSRVEVQKLAIQLADDITAKRNELDEVCAKISKLNTRKSQIESEAGKISGKIKAVQKALVLTDGVPAKLLAIRHRIVQKIETAKRKDITIAKQEKLQREIEELKVQLQKECGHPFVYHIDGYEGDRTHEWENRRPEERFCMVCGLDEKCKMKVTEDHISTSFEMLVESENRMFEEWRGGKSLNLSDIWVHLAVLMKPIEERVAKALNL